MSFPYYPEDDVPVSGDCDSCEEPFAEEREDIPGCPVLCDECYYEESEDLATESVHDRALRRAEDGYRQ